MARSHIKSPDLSSCALDNGNLTDRKIWKYIKEGRYGAELQARAIQADKRKGRKPTVRQTQIKTKIQSYIVK